MKAESPKPVTSFLRWAGSKRRVIGDLAKHYDGTRPVYVEPFAGSAALFFRIAPSEARLSDLNSQLINSLRAVREDPTDVHRRLVSMKRTPTNYYRVRESFNSGRAASHDRAVQFIYLNRNCFNGLWRTDTKGRFNVPHGGDRTGGNPSAESFSACSTLLRRSSLKQCDFRIAMNKAMSSECFVYLDPPYFADDERVFVEYGKKTFGSQELDDLLSLLPKLHKCGAHFVFSYRYDERVIRKCKRWNIQFLDVMRNVGGFSSSRRVDRELLISNG